MSEPPVKRYRRSPTPKSSDDEFDKDEEEYVPYVPVKERTKQKLLKLGTVALIAAEERELARISASSGQSSAAEDGEQEEDREVAAKDSQILEKREEEFLEKNKNVSLLEQHKQLQEIAEAKKETVMEKQRKEEEKILKSVAESTALMGVAELAKGA